MFGHATIHIPKMPQKLPLIFHVRLLLLLEGELNGYFVKVLHILYCKIGYEIIISSNTPKVELPGQQDPLSWDFTSEI